MNWRTIAAIVIGVLALAVGIYLKLFPSAEVMCGTEVMSPGDLCETTRRGVTRTYTYDEMKQNAALAPYALMGVGVLALLFGGFQVWRAKKKVAAEAPAA
ncbi:MAG: hypothetical protein IRY85_18545 [Micromonosporaceae bacterium]|nr:hypothetical protein [Micromonosporaceae bacterium]